AVFLPVRMEQYRAVSARLMAILESHTPLVEKLSIDEAFLDVTGSRMLFSGSEAIARAIKQRIHEELQLTASVGIAPNKFLAKIASDLRKPDGMVIVPADGVAAFLHDLPITRLWGVGPATERELSKLGIATIGALAAYPVAVLRRRFGSSGDLLHALARGEDERPVIPETAAKSIGRETTFPRDIDDGDELEKVLLALAEEVASRLRRYGVGGRTVTLKLRFDDFTTVTRARTLPEPTALAETIYPTARELLHALQRQRRVRLLGITVSKLGPWVAAPQLSLFAPVPDGRQQRLAETVDSLRDRFGKDVLQRARLLAQQPERGKE
ncbi:MAG TPA: DNA polymerase IV, partial [Armatimonadota bacterium]|nr:DNA polymerase IV [Armatimonadota bacterium]